MLKFQRNRTKPELIRIFLVTLIYRLTQQRNRRSPIATKTHKHNIIGHFGKRNPLRYFSYISRVEEYGKCILATRPLRGQLLANLHVWQRSLRLAKSYRMGGGDHCAVWGCDNDRRYPQW